MQKSAHILFIVFYLVLACPLVVLAEPTSDNNPVSVNSESFTPSKSERKSKLEGLGKGVPDPWQSLGKSFKALVYLSTILILGLGLYKKLTPRQTTGEETIRILARKNLSPRSAILFVEIEGVKYVLGQSPEQLCLIAKHADFLDELQKAEEI